MADDSAELRVYGGSEMHVPLRSAVLRRLTPEQVDRALAAVLAVLGELQAALGSPQPHDTRVAMLVTLPMYAALAVRRRYPAAAGFAAQAMVAAGFGVWGGIEVIPYSIAWGCSLYGLTMWTSRRTFAAALAFVVATNLAAATAAGGFGNGVLFTAVTVAVMVLVRRVIGDRERRAQLAERERDVAAREAVLEERARIARELHDVIAHHVSVMVVQAGAERRALDAGAGSTHEVLETIESTGRNALGEMRRLLGMLRDESHGPLAPQPRLEDVPVLVAQLRDAGLPVQLQVEGVQHPLPIGIELSAYRIVQEALTNALKHAGGAPARVRVRYRDDLLELEITDDGSPGEPVAEAGGHGLVGMRERVALCGGQMQAGPNSDGGSLSTQCSPRDDVGPRRRRSGADSRRPGEGARERAGHGRGWRGGRWSGGGVQRHPVAARCDSDGHPHARARRDRGNQADHRLVAAGARADPDHLRPG
jgi:signal transduction histidine kinase